MNRYKVITEWRNNFPEPVILNAGDTVVIAGGKVETDPDWRGWIWCLVGTTGCWIPEQFIVYKPVPPGNKPTVVLTRNYCSLELDINPGEIVLAEYMLNGWIWGRVQNTEVTGWVPVRCLELVYDVL